MKSFKTDFMEKIRAFFSFYEYLFWLIGDISKFSFIDKSKIKKVLIIHLGSRGELMMITPLLPVLKKELSCKISFLIDKEKDIVFKNNPYVDEIFYLEDSFKKNIKNIKNKNFDLAIILYPATFKIGLICKLAKIRYRIGCFPIIRGGPSFFLTRRIFPLIQHKKNAVEENLDMIRIIGLDNKSPKLEFYISDKEKKDLDTKLKKLRVKNYFIIHPGGSFSTAHKYPSKLWPIERYAKIADYIIDKYNFSLFITGSSDEKIFAEKIYRMMKNKKKVIVANDLFNMRELSVLSSKAKILISFGTGLVHIASAFNIPMVIFEGKGSPKLWRPWNKNCKLLFHNEVCTECDLDYCRKKNRECLLSITLDEVIGAVDELLNKSN